MLSNMARSEFELILLMLVLGTGIFIGVKNPQASENIGLNKTASQKTELLPANNAIDGCTIASTACCSETAYEYLDAWWQVNLSRQSVIESITIHYWPRLQVYFAGYSLHLSNSSDWTRGVVCYQEDSETKELVDLNPTHECPYIAQFVTIYNFRDTTNKRYAWYWDTAILTLCEVEVFGCPAGYYGKKDCQESCSQNCEDNLCHPADGSCFFCKVGWFGKFCTLSCPVTCKNHECYSHNGHCKACDVGRHGEDCSLPCPPTCKNNMCNSSNGHCFNCYPGYYGITCGAECPVTCANNCDRESGICTDTPEYDYKILIIVVLSCVAFLCLMLTVLSVICIYRMKSVNTSATDMAQDSDNSAYSSITPAVIETSQ